MVRDGAGAQRLDHRDGRLRIEDHRAADYSTTEAMPRGDDVLKGEDANPTLRVPHPGEFWTRLPLLPARGTLGNKE